MRKIFVSHAVVDREFIDVELLPLLKALGLEPWVCEEAIGISVEFEQTIQEGLNDCPLFAVVMSHQSAVSEGVRDELAWALDHRKGAIVPIRIDDCNPRDFHLRMSRLQYCNFPGKDGQGRLDLTRTLVEFAYLQAAERADRLFLKRASPFELSARWKGFVIPSTAVPGVPRFIEATAEFQRQGEGYSMTMEYDLEVDGHVQHDTLEVSAASFVERVLIGDYVNRRSEVTHFGTMMVQMNHNADCLEGGYVGVGNISQMITHGKCLLTCSDLGPRVVFAEALAALDSP